MIANLNLGNCNLLSCGVLILLVNSVGKLSRWWWTLWISMWMKEHHIKNIITILKFWNGTVLSYKMYNLCKILYYGKTCKNSSHLELVFRDKKQTNKLIVLGYYRAVLWRKTDKVIVRFYYNYFERYTFTTLRSPIPPQCKLFLHRNYKANLDQCFTSRYLWV